MDEKLEGLLAMVNSEILKDFDSEKREGYQALSIKIKDAIKTGCTDSLFVDMFTNQFEDIKRR